MSFVDVAQRAAPLLIAGAAGTVLGRYIETRRRPQPALPSPVGLEPPAPDEHVAAVWVEEPPHAADEAPEDLQDAEVVTEGEAEGDALDPEAAEPAERPSTVDFEALAGHPALNHEPPPVDPPEVAVRAALAEVSIEDGAGVNVEVHEGVAYLRGAVENAEAIGAMHRRVAQVPEITAVENLLHLPGVPPPLASERG